MPARRPVQPSLDFRPLTADLWPDLEALFGKNGACGGCWCMVWRLPRKTWEAQKGEGNRIALKTLVDEDVQPGVLAYVDSQPAGWCAVAPRDEYPALERSRILSPVDDQPVWSISCFFIAKAHRNKGLSVALLNAVIDFVRERGGKLVEGYPVEPKTGKMPAAFAWTGIAAAFRAAGFEEVVRRSTTRPIMRRACASKKPARKR